MTTTKFVLERPTMLAPVAGITNVRIDTTGSCLVREVTASKREPALRLAECQGGRLTMSPKGQHITVTIFLPTEIACEEEFVDRVRLLYDIYRSSWN